MSTNNLAKKIGKYTKYQRKKRKLSINEFAQRVNLTPSFLLRLEQGSYKTVKFSVVQKLAKGFDLSLKDFLVKCEIIESSCTLPELSFFLREKYFFSKKLIEEVELFIDFLQNKYKDEISSLKSKHNKYWSK